MPLPRIPVNGFYSVNGTPFISKPLAYMEASRTKQKVDWWFFDETFQEFRDTQLHTLGAQNLDHFYKVRAQQLRDKYDYLVLCYSGGSDSHNILMTFLNNKIKLDEVFVKWSATVDTKLYTPDASNKDAENWFSEWDFAIKPTLDYLAKNHPEIVINVVDPFGFPMEKIYDDTTAETAFNFMGAMDRIRSIAYSPNIFSNADKGKKVAQIFGIDKPQLVIKDNNCFMFFSDINSSCAPDGTNIHKADQFHTELFYTTPEMPRLAFEQAYACYKWLKNDTGSLDMLQYNNFESLRYRKDPEYAKTISQKEAEDKTAHRLQWFTDNIRTIIYTTWDINKFQVNKPVNFSTAGRSRDARYLTHSEFKPYLERWKHQYDSWLNVVDQTMLSSAKTMTPINSKLYFIGAI